MAENEKTLETDQIGHGRTRRKQAVSRKLGTLAIQIPDKKVLLAGW